MSNKPAIVLLFFLVLTTVAWSSTKMVDIPAGSHQPFFKAQDLAPTSSLLLDRFKLDVTPVTNEDFLHFVKHHPEWRRSQVPSLFADKEYLKRWQGDLDVSPSDLESPVTHISWFAARSYCQAQHKRLPTTAQWEYAAGEGRAANSTVKAQILAWYGRPTPSRLPAVGGPKNAFGVSNLHGLIWEWTEDFDSSFLDESASQAFVCGGGGTLASDSADYASYMRYAFRASLKASFVVANLGLRCSLWRSQ